MAELALQAVEQGRYLVKAPDTTSNLIIAAGAGIAPRMFPVLIELLLAPIYVLLYIAGGTGLDKRILQWRSSA